VLAPRFLESTVYLMRIGPPGAEKPAARVDDDRYVDLSDVVGDFDEAFFGGGGLDRVRPVVAERVAAGRVSRFAGERVGAPIARPHQILCIGLNYRDHAAETGQAVPAQLQPGDVMELGIEGLGTQRQTVLGRR
jgi:2,4-didehydro-3-deoxy-L-rhamnonate hydrolase